MTLREYESLTQDEIDILLFLFNTATPRVMPYEIEPHDLLYIRRKFLEARVCQCEQFVKDEFKLKYGEMKTKLNIS